MAPLQLCGSITKVVRLVSLKFEMKTHFLQVRAMEIWPIK